MRLAMAKTMQRPMRRSLSSSVSIHSGLTLRPAAVTRRLSLAAMHREIAVGVDRPKIAGAPDAARIRPAEIAIHDRGPSTMISCWSIDIFKFRQRASDRTILARRGSIERDDRAASEKTVAFENRNSERQAARPGSGAGAPPTATKRKLSGARMPAAQVTPHPGPEHLRHENAGGGRARSNAVETLGTWPAAKILALSF